MSYPSVGEYVKKELIAGLTVIEAARRLGVARQTLHTFLSGKSTLSIEMATKLEQNFNCSTSDLLAMQGEIDKQRSHKQQIAQNAAGYLTFSAAEIESWSQAKHVSSRSDLPLLIRRLAFATTSDLTELMFHGGEESQRPGWDGETTSNSGSPKVPAGKSGWELSISVDLPKKPNDDIRQREEKLTAAQRKKITFIYVTSRIWRDKKTWIEKHQASGKWRDVRAYDAADLSEWLELSLATQIWFAEQIGRPDNGVKSLERAWNVWSKATKPALSRHLFKGSIESNSSVIVGWLENDTGLPLVIAADSIAEGLAWLSCALNESVLASAVVVSTLNALWRVTAATTKNLIVIENEDVEKEAAPYLDSHRIVIIRIKRSIDNKPNITLSQADNESFRLALIDMKYTHSEVSALSINTAQSPTILRRHLAELPVLKNPAWSTGENNRKLIPLLLAGAWNKTNEWDKTIIRSLMADNSSDEEIESNLTELLALPEAPVWAVENYRGIVCRRDVLFGVASSLNDSDVKKFLKEAELVLSEPDPALDLPPENRWAANIYGKRREISTPLRRAIGEMLVLLAVHGDMLIKGRFNKITPQIDALVEKLLLGGSTQELVSLSSDLTSLAEASPLSFLLAIESDLDTNNPQTLAMLRSTAPGGFDRSDRLGLLWALEILAWDPTYYFRVVRILAKLSEVTIVDNTANKPENSLESLVSCWCPQTDVDIDGRVKALRIIVTENPEVGWRVCLAQLVDYNRFTTLNPRPTYRSTAQTKQDFISESEKHKMCCAALDFVLYWDNPDLKKLGELLKLERSLNNVDQQRLIRTIDNWLVNNPSDEQKSEFKEMLRLQGYPTIKKLLPKNTKSLKTYLTILADRLEPVDPVEKHRWLFIESWIPESSEDLLNKAFNYEKRELYIAGLRDVAMAEVFNHQGVGGVLRILNNSNTSYTVGLHLSRAIPETQAINLIRDLFNNDDKKLRIKCHECARGVVSKPGKSELLELTSLATTLQCDSQGVNDEMFIRLVRIYPVNSSTWDTLNLIRPDLVAKYWSEVVPNTWGLESRELQQMVENLIQANRPRAAFCSIRFAIEKLDGQSLAKLMKALVTNSNEEEGTYLLDEHSLSLAMERVNQNRFLSTDEMASLEWAFASSLTHTEYGIPNLERKITSQPDEFVRLVALKYKRSDDGVDPERFQYAVDENWRALFRNIDRVLESISRTPGSTVAGEIDVADLTHWITEVRKQFSSIARIEIGDQYIGQLLGRCPAGKDGVWPHEAVRLALESTRIVGISMGIEHSIRYPNRRVLVPTSGKRAELDRELERKYRTWSKSIESTNPFTSRMLDNIANSYRLDAERHVSDHSVRNRLGFLR